MKKEVEPNEKCRYEEPKTDIIYLKSEDIITESLGDENWGDEWDGRE